MYRDGNYSRFPLGDAKNDIEKCLYRTRCSIQSFNVGTGLGCAYTSTGNLQTQGILDGEANHESYFAKSESQENQHVVDVPKSSDTLLKKLKINRRIIYAIVAIISIVLSFIDIT